MKYVELFLGMIFCCFCAYTIEKSDPEDLRSVLTLCMVIIFTMSILLFIANWLLEQYKIFIEEKIYGKRQD